MIKCITKVRKIKDGFQQAYFIDGDVEILLSTIKKDTSLDKHNHPQGQFGYCFSGSFGFFVEGNKNIINPGGSYLLAGDYYHSAEATEEFYALDFKYLSSIEQKETFKLDVLSVETDAIITRKGIAFEKANIKAIKSNQQDLAIALECLDSHVFIVVKDEVLVGIKDDIIKLKPMEIYKLSDVDTVNLKIKEIGKEIVLIFIDKK